MATLLASASGMSSARATSLHGRLRLHRPEGDDLGDVLTAVLPRDVLDDLAATALAEVDVDIRQRHALGVQEALENEVVLQRIDVGDAQAERDQAASRRSAPGADRNPLLARIADEIPDDQEVSGVAHPLDHLDLVREPGFVLVETVAERAGRHHRAQSRQPFGEALADHVLEVRIEGVALGHGEVRQVVFGRAEIDVAALGDSNRIRQRLRELRPEDVRHLVAGLQVELVAVIAQPVLVVDRAGRPDAQQDVVGDVIALLQVVDVVGGDQAQTELARDRRQPAVDDLLVLDAVPLQLEEKTVLPENVAEGGRGLHRLGGLIGGERLRNFALETAAQADDARRVPREQFLVDARFPVEPLGVAGRHELDQVVPAFFRFGQQHQVVVILADGPAPIVTAAWRHIDLAAQDRVDAPLPRVIVERDRREHVAVLGDGNPGHAVALHLLEQLVDAAGAVEQRELGVQVEVNEVGHRLMPVDG